MFYKKYFLVVFLIFKCCVTSLAATQLAEDGVAKDWNMGMMLKDLVKIVGWYFNIIFNDRFERGLKVNLTELFINQNKKNPNNTILGTFNATNVSLVGLDGLLLTELPNISKTSYDTGDYYAITLGKITLDDLGLNMNNYSMDIAIFDQLPLYGEGNITLKLQSISVKIDMALVKLTKKTKADGNPTWMIDNFDIDISFRHSKMGITGFFKNQQLDGFLTGLLTTLESFVAMWWDYNSQTISCVLGDIIKYVINKNLFKIDDVKLDIKSDCLDAVSVKVANVLQRIKTNDDWSEFVTLLEQKHIDHLIDYVAEELTHFSDL